VVLDMLVVLLRFRLGKQHPPSTEAPYQKTMLEN